MQSLLSVDLKGAIMPEETPLAARLTAAAKLQLITLLRNGKPWAPSKEEMKVANNIVEMLCGSTVLEDDPTADPQIDSRLVGCIRRAVLRAYVAYETEMQSVKYNGSSTHFSWYAKELKLVQKRRGDIDRAGIVLAEAFGAYLKTDTAQGLWTDPQEIENTVSLLCHLFSMKRQPLIDSFNAFSEEQRHALYLLIVEPLACNTFPFRRLQLHKRLAHLPQFQAYYAEALGKYATEGNRRNQVEYYINLSVKEWRKDFMREWHREALEQVYEVIRIGIKENDVAAYRLRIQALEPIQQIDLHEALRYELTTNPDILALNLEFAITEIDIDIE